MKLPYSFRNFWLPFIIMNIVIILVGILTQTMDTGFGILYISIFYFYNRGYKNGQKQYGLEDANPKSNKPMAFFKKALSGGAYTIGTIAYLVLGIAGAIIHLWTILMAFGSSGFIAALITLATPPVSEFYWAYYALRTTHTVFNTYWFALAIYLAAWVIVGILYFIGSASSPDEE